MSSDDTANVLGAVVAKSMEFDDIVLRIEDRSLLPICEKLELQNVIVPDRRVAEELMAFAEGSSDALSSEQESKSD